MKMEKKNMRGEKREKINDKSLNNRLKGGIGKGKNRRE